MVSLVDKKKQAFPGSRAGAGGAARTILQGVGCSIGKVGNYVPMGSACECEEGKECR